MNHLIVAKIFSVRMCEMYAKYFSGVIKEKERKLQNWFDACKSMKSAINMTDHRGDNFDRVGDLPLTD